MAFQKGKSGNPGGRSAERSFADALRAAVNVEDPATKRRRLVLIAEKVVDLAIAGESWAVAQIADRLDGKPIQQTDLSITDNRDLRDLSASELAARTSAALARVEELTNGTAGPGAGEEMPADVRKLN